ncbi:MAG: hypothetical protein DRP47_00085 [Candidatus Zixiibacteriota bacterium]|nr:MAG: hypothetical protein DRP47_00085 [candidate division Zixibacteria bacterium]
MSATKKNNSVIAICIQEPYEDGSSMDLGVIKEDELRKLHQAFITDTINHALEIPSCDILLYYIDQPNRHHLVEIVTKYLSGKLSGKSATNFKKRFKSIKLSKDPWGKRIEKVFKDCFKSGYKHVLVIGSRTPTVHSSKLDTALKMLKESDAVFGPTPEGRYYLIGMSKESRINLAEFDWKSPSIYSTVADAFTEKELAWSELEIWYCVESPDELELMVRDINQWRFEGDESTARETEIALERILAKLD